MLSNLLTQLQSYRAMRARQTSRYRMELDHIPSELFPYWQSNAHHEFKGIPRDAFFFARALDGLLTFFDCVRQSGRQCALPSMAVDSVWHAWIRMDADGLDTFCVKHFGRTIPHKEAATMADDMDLALAVSLVQARTLDRLPTAGSRVPRLFAMDRVLRMPHGYDYSVLEGEVGFGRMNARGQRAGPIVFPPSLGVHRLFSEGLVTAEAYGVARRARNLSSGATGTAAGVGGGDCGGGGGDGGGGGCGAGCGGGS